MPAKNATRAAKPAVKETLVKESVEETQKETEKRAPLTETQKEYLKMRSVTRLMDSLIETHKDIIQVQVYAYKTAKSKAFGRDQLTAEVFKVILVDKTKKQVKFTTSDLWELYKIRPKINLTAKASIKDIKVVPGVADKDYDNMEGILNSFIHVIIPVTQYSLENGGHYYCYKIANVYSGDRKEKMCKALESFNEITTDKELHKKYRWNDESAKIDAIEEILLSDDEDDDE